MRPRHVLWGALALGAATWSAGWLGYLAGYEQAEHVENVGWVLTAVAAGFAALTAAFDPSQGRSRIAFGSFGLGCFAWAVGQGLWTYAGLQGDTWPFPGPADVGYLLSLPLLALGVLTWPRRRRSFRNNLWDALLGLAVAALVSFEVAIEPILVAWQGGLGAWIGLAYPATELMLFGAIVVGLLVRSWADRGRIVCIAIGLLTLVVADTAFALAGESESMTTFLDAGWTLPFLSIGIAALTRPGWGSTVVREIPKLAVVGLLAVLLGIAAFSDAVEDASEIAVGGLVSYVVAVMLVVVTTRALLVAHAHERGSRELRRAQHKLRQAQRSRDRFLVELVNTQERGSRKIADLLHDDVVQQLTALGFRLELEAQKNDLPKLRELATDTSLITGSIRQLLIELHPAILESQGLAPAIDVVAEGLRERGIDVRVSPFPHRLPREMETLAYRLVQEALANVLRHSAASSAEVELRLNENTLRCRVSDTGLGIQPAARRLTGIGLLVARERVELAGGRLLVDAGANRGTDFVFELPIVSDAPAEEVAS